MIEEKVQKELREIYNPDGSLLRKAQLRMLDMLKYLDGVCREIGVNYRIDSGTILGAVRHGGFIPWDDDVDVAIDNRQDYQRLCDYLLLHPHSKYIIQNEHTEDTYLRIWSTLRDLNSEYIHKDKSADILDRAMKYRGLQIDIFPYKAGIIPILSRISGLVYSLEQKAVLKTRIMSKLIHWIRMMLIHPLFNAITFLVGNKNYYMHSYGTGFKNRIHKNHLLPYKPILFEGYEFMGPADPEGYLKSVYGDYMKLPPLNQRNHHNVEYRIWDSY